MQFMAGITAGAVVTPIPWKLMDDVSIWSQNWSWIPSLEYGESTFAPVTSKTCPSCAPLSIRLVGGRPVRALPRPDHELGGGLTALAAAEVHLLHSPARVLEPQLKKADGTFAPIGRDEAEKLLQEKLAKAGAKTAVISGDVTGSVNEVLSAFAGALGSSDVFLMPSEAQAAAKACQLAGLSAEIGYDLENSDHVLAIGANIMETWGTVARNRRLLSSGKTSLSYAGPVQNSSAAGAKTWLPIYPGTEAAFALGIAHLLVARGRSASTADYEEFRQLAADHDPKTVSQLTGVPVQLLYDAVNALEIAAAPLVVVGGDNGGSASPAAILAGIGLNALLGNINKKGGLLLRPMAAKAVSKAMSRRDLLLNDLVGRLAQGFAPEALLVHEANPLFALPNRDKVKAAFDAIPFKVSFTTLMDETAMASDLVLPIPMGLERLDDVQNPYGCGHGIYCLTAPAVKPPAGMKGTAETCLSLAKAMGQDLGVGSWEGLLQSKATLMQGNYKEMLKGKAVMNAETEAADDLRLRPDVLRQALAVPAPQNAFRLAVYSRLSMGTAKTGIPPYNTKTLRANELAGKDMYVLMNGFTATKNGLTSDLRVRLQCEDASITALVRVWEGVANDTVAVCNGFGHTALDEFSRNKGANVMDIVPAVAEPGTGFSIWSQPAVNVVKA